MIEWQPAPKGGFELSVLKTPVGAMWVIHAANALVAAKFGSQLPTRYGECGLAPVSCPEWIQRLVDQAFAGEPLPLWPAADTGFTSLERIMLSTATEIAFGTTASYGTVAAWAGYPGRARAAGRAMSRSPIAYLIPTHRVIRSDGRPAPCQRDSLNRRLRGFEHIDFGP